MLGNTKILVGVTKIAVLAEGDHWTQGGGTISPSLPCPSPSATCTCMTDICRLKFDSAKWMSIAMIRRRSWMSDCTKSLSWIWVAERHQQGKGGTNTKPKKVCRWVGVPTSPRRLNQRDWEEGIKCKLHNLPSLRNPEDIFHAYTWPQIMCMCSPIHRFLPTCNPPPSH